MFTKISITTLILVAVLAIGCSSTNEAGTANANASSATEATTRPGPDNSEITSSVDANGTKTETRVFHNNPRVARVVVTTTKNGTRTVKAYSPSGEERPVSSNEDPLTATGEKVADAAGRTKDKTVDAAGTVKETSEKVGEKTADTAKDVAKKTADTTKQVGEKTVEGTKTVVKKTESGVKKTGNAVKKVIP